MSSRTAIRKRKSEHLTTCLRRPVEFARTRTWFEHVHLIHQAVATFSPRQADVATELLGRKLSAPFFIAAMTGGTAEARRINRKLAKVAAEKGIGLAVGSQRPMLEDPALTRAYRLRDVAPDILLLGNIGLAQAITAKTAEVVGLMNSIGADGMCLHLNVPMEMFQKGGDAPSHRAHACIRRLSRALGRRLVVKETGCGISRETARRLVRLGVATIDAAGAGGTSWVRVENLRQDGASDGPAEFEEWGIPTAASLLELRGLRVRVIASGGLRTGLDLAKAVALGAAAGSAALPALRALDRGGVNGLRRWIDSVTQGLRVTMVLTGCRDLKALRRAPVVITGPLLEWATQRKVWRTPRGHRR